MTPTEQLQKIIRDCGLSRYELAQRTGVSEGVLSRFVASNRGITTDTIDRLAPVLGLKITGKKVRKDKGR